MKRKFNFILMLIASVVVLASCNAVSPDGGQEAVLVKKPWFFGHGGVEAEPVQSGLTWCALSTHEYIFNLKPVMITEEFDDLMTSDNVAVDFNAYITLQAISGKTPQLYEKFGIDFYQNNIKEPFRTFLRNYPKKQTLFDLTTNADVLTRGEVIVETQIKRYIDSLKIPVIVKKVTIGMIAPPDAVLLQTNATAAQKQMKKTNEERALAELTREQAEKNSAKADKAYRNESGMTVDQYLRMQEIEVQKAQISMAEKHKNANITMIFNQGAIPMLNAK